MRINDNQVRTHQQSQDLFFELVEELNEFEQPNAGIPSVLEKICSYLAFGCAFVYESDHTKKFHLKEHHVSYDNSALHQQFRLENIFEKEDILGLCRAPVMFFNEANPDIPLELKIASFFKAKTILAIPILDEDAALIGCVGLMDRRSSLLLTEQEISMTRTIFSIIASQVKLRFYEQRLLFTQTTLEGIMDNTGIDIYVNDFDTHEILYVNKSMAEPYGGLENMLGKKCWEALYDDKTEECEYCPKKDIIDKNGEPTKIHSWDYQRPFDGSWYRVLSAAFRWIDGRLAHVISSINITESKSNEFLIQKMAFHDSLTNAPNRSKFQYDFNEYIEKYPDKPATIMFLDLDDFKSINDSLGHFGGDELLIRITKLMQLCCPVPESVYRYGGDEFVIFLRNTEYQAATVIDHLLKCSSREHLIRGKKVKCGVSIGIVEYPKDGTECDDLLESADIAMYNVKDNGKNNAAYFMEEKGKQL